MYGKVENDDLLKPGEYMEVGVYQEVSFNSEGHSHYKSIHSFLVPCPVKFWYMDKIADYYDVIIAGKEKVFFFYE